MKSSYKTGDDSGKIGFDNWEYLRIRAFCAIFKACFVRATGDLVRQPCLAIIGSFHLYSVVSFLVVIIHRHGLTFCLHLFYRA
jgi:hypothetical protein